MFYGKAIPNNFAKFLRQRMCRSLHFNKVAGMVVPNPSFGIKLLDIHFLTLFWIVRSFTLKRLKVCVRFTSFHFCKASFPDRKSSEIECNSLREKCPNTELFLFYIFLYSDWCRKIRTRSNSVFRHFSRSDSLPYLTYSLQVSIVMSNTEETSSTSSDGLNDTGISEPVLMWCVLVRRSFRIKIKALLLIGFRVFKDFWKAFCRLLAFFDFVKKWFKGKISYVQVLNILIKRLLCIVLIQSHFLYISWHLFKVESVQKCTRMTSLASFFCPFW